MAEVDITQQNQTLSVRLPGGSSARKKTTGLLRKWSIGPQEEQLVAENLAWVARHFNVPRARIVRQIQDGTWIIQTIIQGNPVAQQADRAEIAMVWYVALSGGPVRAARPRVTTSDGEGVRPIAMTNYLGLPVISRNRLAGVVEVGGDISRISRSSIHIATQKLEKFGCRLLLDPSLRPQQQLTADTECSLGGGLPFSNTMRFNSDDWSFVSAIEQTGPLGDLALRLDLDLDDAISLAQTLIERGAIQARVPTRMLSSTAATEKYI